MTDRDPHQISHPTKGRSGRLSKSTCTRSRRSGAKGVKGQRVWPFQGGLKSIPFFLPIGALEYFERVRTCRLQVVERTPSAPPARADDGRVGDAKPPAADPGKKLGRFMGPKETHFSRAN